MEWHAPVHWRCVDFISDIHLHAGDPLTFAVWRDYLRTTTADAVCILGDLFETWVGDDVLTLTDSFEQRCAAALRAASARLPVYLMHGNRDFLLGHAAMQACAATWLPDPCVLVFAHERLLLTHGDALCLADSAYQQFRAQVRQPHWQQEFLRQPLAQRQTLAQAMRAQSQAHQGQQTALVDVDAAAVAVSLDTHNARYLIHGHTHRPGTHVLDAGCQRLALCDWDQNATPPRAEALRAWNHEGRLRLERLPLLASVR